MPLTPQRSVAWCPAAMYATSDSRARWTCCSEISPERYVNAEGNRRFEEVLRATRTPGHPTHRPVAVTDHLRPTLQSVADLADQRLERFGFAGSPDPAEILVIELPFDRPAHQPRQLDIVAVVGMPVERQVQ